MTHVVYMYILNGVHSFMPVMAHAAVTIEVYVL